MYNGLEMALRPLRGGEKRAVYYNAKEDKVICVHSKNAEFFITMHDSELIHVMTFDRKTMPSKSELISTIDDIILSQMELDNVEQPKSPEYRKPSETRITITIKDEVYPEIYIDRDFTSCNYKDCDEENMAEFRENNWCYDDDEGDYEWGNDW